MWELDHKEGWALKKWCFQIVVLEKTLESLLDCKEIKPVHPKGNQPWILTGRTDAETEASILWPPDAKSHLIGKDPDAEKDWGQEEKGMTEDEIVGWHHWLNGHEFEQTPRDTEGQRSLVCYGPWGCKSWTWFREWTTTGEHAWRRGVGAGHRRNGAELHTDSACISTCTSTPTRKLSEPCSLGILRGLPHIGMIHH